MVAEAWLIAGLQRQKTLKPLSALIDSGATGSLSGGGPAPIGKQLRAWAALHNLKHASKSH